MGSMQCNVEFRYQLSIYSGTKENHEKPWSSWPVAGPSGCILTSSQQSGIKSASPNISSYLRCCVLLFWFFFNQLFFFTIIVMCIWYGFAPTAYNTCGRNRRICKQICIQIYISVSVILWLSLNFLSPLYFGKSDVFTRFVAYPVTKIMFHS
jgi:hypothetical protein